MNYAKILKYDTNNWEGITTTVFFSGCRFNCPGCFNKELHDFNYGSVFDRKTQDKFIEYAGSHHVTGVCILGGEPFQQDLNELYKFVLRLRTEVNKPIHVWTGYLYEELLHTPRAADILYLIDTLVDGRFIMVLKEPNLKYRGSSNQRVIDVRKSLKERTTVLLDC